MSMQMQTAVRETLRDFALVSPFCFWAVMIGFVPVLAIGILATALAYVLGIASTRMLGSRLASFVALAEVVAAMLFGWMLLDQLPGPVQLLGGALVLIGVVVVKLGEPAVESVIEPLPLGP